MLKEVLGNIFDSDKHTIVNAVNCEGVMGAGIALEYRLRYPKMFEKYKAFCEAKKIDIGTLWIYKPEKGPWILNFPTKKHWKYPTKEEYLRDGLEKLCATYQERGIKSIAFPMLGADKGGLGKDKSLEVMSSYLIGLNIEVDIYQYDPNATDQLCEYVKKIIFNHEPSQFQHMVKFRRGELDKVKEVLENQLVGQLSQLLVHKGIGQKTVEKLYLLSKFDVIQTKSGLFD